MAAPTLLEIDATQETLKVEMDSRDASAIQGRSIETGTPTDGEVLTYSSSGSEWIYQTITENVDDRVAALIQDSATGGLTWTYDDAAGTLTPSNQLVNADIAAAAEIAVSKLADGSARQLLQTDSGGTGVEWTSNVDVPGTLDVTGAAVFDSSVTAGTFTGALTGNVTG